MLSTSPETPRPRRRGLRRFALCCALLLLAGVGCASEVGHEPDSSSEASSSAEGKVGLALIVGDGVALGDVHYTITNAETDYAYMATVSYSALKSDGFGLFLILPAATGYQLDIQADLLGPTGGPDGGSCVGSADFDIKKDERTPVAVQLHCNVLDNTGSADIEGKANACPKIDSAAAFPPKAQIEDVIVLQAHAIDIDAAPSALSYSWNAELGDLGDSNQPNATLVCTQPGITDVELTVSDGDQQCNATVHFTVECVAPPPKPATP
jgi:hypothetical protein